MLVQTKYGKIDGMKENGCYIYKGIPYAKPPVGKLRFAKPQKPDAWDGILMADKFGNRSMQRTQAPGSFYQKEFYNDENFMTPMSEDCLYLNIWVPDETENKEKTEKLPVAIYIHGGAFMSGAGSNLPFVANELAKKGVIIVTVNYRVGVWGFLCHPVLEKKNKTFTSGNYGLWDQIAALQWIKENIAEFGGDAENITLFGQSAGAMSLQILALSPKTEGMYQKMILQSGGGYKNPLAGFRTKKEAEQFGEWFLEFIGEGLSEEERVEKLEHLSAEELQKAAEETIGRSFQNQMGIPFMPVIDGEILLDDCNSLIEKKEFHKVKYILGANANDITMENAADHSQENNPMQKANVAYARIANEAGCDSYVYYFTRQLPGDESGAFHSAELWYVFGSLDYCWRKDYMTSEDWELSEKIMTYWTNFMKLGNPNGEVKAQSDMEEWEPYKKEKPYVKIF